MPNKSEAPIMHCPTCYSTNFQISKARPEDRLQIWLLKQPVRCRKCNARIYASRSYGKWLRKETAQRDSNKTLAKTSLPAS
jgi:Zn finger protein HypA/HybF involved in hydrogenase expression